MLSKQVKDRRYKNRLTRAYSAWRRKEIRRLNKSLMVLPNQALMSAKHSENPQDLVNARKRFDAVKRHNDQVLDLVDILLSSRYLTKKQWFAIDSLSLQGQFLLLAQQQLNLKADEQWFSYFRKPDPARSAHADIGALSL